MLCMGFGTPQAARMYFCDAAFAPGEDNSPLLGMYRAIDGALRGPDAHIADTLYTPLHGALKHSWRNTVAIYDKLQPMALHVGDIGGHPLGRYRAYEFPAVWAQALREDVFTPEDDEAGDEPRGLPLWAVTNAISALMPQVLTNDARGLARTTWLAWNTVANGPAPVERRGDGVLAPARVRQQEQHPLSVVLYPAPERADPAVRPFPADPRPRRIRRWARSPVFDAERAIGVHLLSPSPWADHTSPFGIASIKWHKSWSGTGGYLGWNDDLAPTLARLTTQDRRQAGIAGPAERDDQQCLAVSDRFRSKVPGRGSPDSPMS
jgi:hypothetical protein